MNPRVRTVVMGLGVLAVALLPAVADSPPATRAPAADPEAVAVSLEHEVVAAAIIVEPAAPRQPASRSRSLARRHTRTDGFISRARQLIVGDGRYRPEPFPRAGR